MLDCLCFWTSKITQKETIFMNIKEAVSSRFSRRQVLVTGLGALGLVLLSPLRNLFAQSRPILKEKKSVLAFDAGKPESYALQKVDGRFRAFHGVWIIRHLDSFYALSVKTPDGHLTEWNEAGQFFMTPSGQRYYKSGICYQGSIRKALPRVRITLTASGHLEVDSARSFRQEFGEWAHPQSFLNLKGTGLAAKQVILPTPGTVPVTR